MRIVGILPNLLPALLAASVSVGCTAMPKVPETVRVPTPVACIAPADVPKNAAVRTRDDLLALPEYQGTWALWAEWLKLREYADAAAPLLAKCAEIPPP